MTTTLCVPVPAGVVAVIVVELDTFTLVAGLVPNFDGSPADEAGAGDGYGSSPGQWTTKLGRRRRTTGLGAARTGRARKRDEPIIRIIKNNDERNFLFISTPFLKLNY